MYHRAVIEPPPPTFEDVRNLLSQNCVICHVEKGPAPFELTQVEDYRKRSSFIGSLIQEDRMPPHLSQKDRWTDLEKSLVLQWLQAISSNDQHKSVPIPDPPKFRADQTFVTPKGFTIPSEGGERWHQGDRDIRTFRLAPRVEKTLRVQAWRFESTAQREVESVALVHDDGTVARYGDLQEPETPGYEMTGDMGLRPAGFLGVLGIGNPTFRIPTGYHFEIPESHEIDFELRFRPSGLARAFSATLDAELVPQDHLSRALQLVPLSIRSWRANAGESGTIHRIWKSPISMDVPLLSVRAGRRVKDVTLKVDDRVVFQIHDWDPHWQQTWETTNLRVAKNAKLEAIFTVDNSDQNPRNPETPPKDIQFGRRTGALGVWLHAAACEPDETSSLQILRRQMFTALQTDGVMSPEQTTPGQSVLPN